MKIPFALLDVLHCRHKQTDRHYEAPNYISATFYHDHAQKQYLTNMKLYLAVASLHSKCATIHCHLTAATSCTMLVFPLTFQTLTTSLMFMPNTGP